MRRNSGAEGWIAVEQYGRQKEAWLKEFLELRGGIPSHDTIGRVFSALHPDELSKVLYAFVQALAGPQPEAGANVLAVEGKTLRRSFEVASGQSALHVVSVVATSSQTVICSRRARSKGHEIESIRAVLEQVDLQGRTVTIDAAGCQSDIAQRIAQAQGDYVLTLKRNQAGCIARGATGWSLQSAAGGNTHGRGRCLATGGSNKCIRTTHVLRADASTC